MVEDSGEFIVHTLDIIIDIFDTPNLSIPIGKPGCIQKVHITPSDNFVGPALFLMTNSVSFYDYISQSFFRFIT